MTNKGNQTMQLTRSELDALPEWRKSNGNKIEGAMFRTTGTGPTREPKLVKIVRNPPMFDLTPVWFHTELV